MEGLGCIGNWGSYYGDMEMYRWSMALLRHYAVEGRTEMLSERYGYRYRPGLLANGDFRGSLKGWSAAERDAKLSWVYSDRRKNRKCEDCARVTVHHIVFTARASELALTLASTAKEPSFRLGVNGVCVNPYFE